MVIAGPFNLIRDGNGWTGERDCLGDAPDEIVTVGITAVSVDEVEDLAVGLLMVLHTEGRDVRDLAEHARSDG
jgi:hypothetical protein